MHREQNQEPWVADSTGTALAQVETIGGRRSGVSFSPLALDDNARLVQLGSSSQRVFA